MLIYVFLCAVFQESAFNSSILSFLLSEPERTECEQRFKLTDVPLRLSFCSKLFFLVFPRCLLCSRV